MTNTEIYQSQAEKQFRIWSETDRMTNAKERTAYVRACTDMEKVAIASVQTIITLPRLIDDSPHGLMTTDFRKRISVVYYIRVKDSTATVTGKWNMPDNSYMQDYEIIVNKGSEKSAYGVTWQAMVDISSKMGGVIAYTKE